jgi:hypothetical protein
VNNTYDSLLNEGQYSQLNVGVAYNTSTSATDVSPGGNTAGQALTLNGATLQPGSEYRVTARGIVSTTGTPNLTLGVYYGGVAGVALATTGAIATGSGLSNVVWTLQCDVRVVNTGTSGSAYALGTVTGPYVASTVAIPASSSSGNLVTVNTSTANLLTVGATWGTSSASNTLQVIFFRVERLNEGGS